MGASLRTADPVTHLKIVIVAMALAIAVVWAAIASRGVARLSEHSTGVSAPASTVAILWG